MGLRASLARFAADSAIPTFAIAGQGGREAVQDLRLRRELRLLDTPRPASLLLVAGAIPPALETPLARVHDTMAHPRATLLWDAGTGHGASLEALPHAVQIRGDPIEAARAVYRDLLAGRRASEPPILPDVDPAPWRGIGPYGQGGSGMTGGTPYGRPMAELGPDPDGLRLDVLPVEVGPLFSRFPAGLALDVRFAGDLVLEATARTEATGDRDVPVRPGLRPFMAALSRSVPIAELEMARARDHLRWLSDALVAHGLRALGLRALRLATTIMPGDAAAVRDLERRISRTQIMRWSTNGIGRLDAATLAGLGAGPVGRAAGLSEDVRTDDPAYRDLGFEPVLGDDGDAAARWRVRLAETTQSLELAARAGGRLSTPLGRVESPRGRLEPGSAPFDRLLPLLSAVLHETEWGDAVATVMSLDLDLDESAVAAGLVGSEAAA